MVYQEGQKTDTGRSVFQIRGDPYLYGSTRKIRVDPSKYVLTHIFAGLHVFYGSLCIYGSTRILHFNMEQFEAFLKKKTVS